MVVINRGQRLSEKLLGNYAAFFFVAGSRGNEMIAGAAVSGISTTVFESLLSLPSAISLSATSDNPIPGGTAMSGRWPRTNCRTRRRTILTSSSLLGTAEKALLRSLEFMRGDLRGDSGR